jgi:hypothetical protein
MSGRLAPAQIAALALCLLMALLFAYELSAAPAQFTLPDIHLKPRTYAAVAAAPFVPPDASAFDAINERPLFLPTRKAVAAPPSAGAAAGGPPAPADVVLVGVLLDGHNSVAEVKSAGAPFAQAAHVGDSIGNWTISSIGPDRIVLKSGTFSQEIHMDAKAGSPPAGAQPPPGTAQ